MFLGAQNNCDMKMVLSRIHNICIGGESRGFRGLKMADSCQNPSIQGRLFFAVSLYTDQIGTGFEADTLENESNMSIYSDFQTKIWLKSY